MKTMKNTTIAAVVQLNDRLFEQEREVDHLLNAVSAQRYYLAAEKSEERVLELYSALADLRAARERMEQTRADLTATLDNIFDPANWNE